MIIWHVWDGSDMAQSDSFFPTKSAAIAHVRENYDGVIFKPRDGLDYAWIGYEHNNDKGFDINLVREDIRLTRQGLCSALRYIPNR